MKDCFFREGKMYENIGGIDILYPPMPEKEKILFYDLQQKDQKWRPTKLPDCFDEIDFDDNDNPLWTEEQLKFIIQEKKRFKEGIWFYNNGIPTYITGHHYFELSYWHIDSGLKEYRDRDRRVYMHLKYCFDDPNCYGQIYMKHRRDGATWRALSVQYIDTIMKKNIHSGIQSKTESDAEMTFLKMVFAWKKLPQFLRPAHDGTDNPKNQLNFVQPARKKGAKKVKKTSDGSLYSLINYESSNPFAYDGKKLYRYYGDEFGKTIEVDVTETWKVVKPCLELGRFIVGKAMITTTVEKMEKGGQNFKILWHDSDPFAKSVQDTGRTISGLYKLFIPAYDGFEGYIDEYGYSIIEPPTEEQVLHEIALRRKEGKAEEEIQASLIGFRKGARGFLQSYRKALVDEGKMADLSDFKRKFPFTEAEALQSTTSGCHFDLHKLESRDLELSEWETKGRPLWESGDFYWTNGFGSSVEFRKKINGKWRVCWLPKQGQKNLVSKSGGITRPLGAHIFKMGCDPVDRDIVIDPSRASNAAFHVFKEADIHDGDVFYNENFIVEYLARPPIREIFYEDLLMTCHFFGAKVLVESQRGEGVFAFFLENGYDDFIMRRPESTTTNWSGGSDLRGIPMSEAVKRQMLGKMESFVYNHAHRMRFTRTITDLKTFNIQDMRPSDLSVSFGLTLLSRKEVLKVETIEDIDVSSFIKRYDITGTHSKLIN